jgi:hypothetical protein
MSPSKVNFFIRALYRAHGAASGDLVRAGQAAPSRGV